MVRACRKNFMKGMLMMLLALLLLMCGCSNNVVSNEGFSTADPSAQFEESVDVEKSSTNDSEMQGDVLGETGEDEENVVRIGIIQNAHGWREIKKDAENFNMAQSQYRVEIVEYSSYAGLVTDLMRKQGADIYSIWDLPIEILAQKEALEDLTPYFEESDVVKLEDLTLAVRRAGMVEEKIVCVIPAFAFEGIIVEKGHTQDGGWTVADYVKLASEYPEGMLNSAIKDTVNLFLNDLALVPDEYINWDEKTCNFESDEFVGLLEELKILSEKHYELSPAGTTAERLYRREYLTVREPIHMDNDLTIYMNLKEVLGDEFEFAGFPGGDGKLMYRMQYDKIYGMNAASSKKEGAWAFLEYLLSENVQYEMVSASSDFSARTDVTDMVLQEFVDFQVPEHYSYSSINTLTEERITEYRPVSEQDKQIVLEMLDNVYRFEVVSASDIYEILLDELKYFFDGSKSAKEVAALIQNRIQLYLME